MFHQFKDVPRPASAFAKRRTSPKPESSLANDEKLDHLSLETLEVSDRAVNGHLLQEDVEAQSPDASKLKLPHVPSRIAAEYDVETRTKFLYLAGWFTLNLSLTIYNKTVLGRFAFPWLLTAIHTSCVSVGCYFLMLRGVFQLTELTLKENLILIAFSFLFTLNIAISNVSLAAVSVPFHQMMRSTCPVFTMIIYRIIYSRTYARETYYSTIPIIFGVAMATYGDYYFTLAGFVLTLLGVVLASIKTVVTNRLMTGNLRLPALEILLRMSPLAAIQSLLYASATSEFSNFKSFVGDGHLTRSYAFALLGNGVLAFFLNVSSFQTNKLAGALTITVAGNIKQCLTIALGIMLFNVEVGLLNGCGMLITLAGAAWYSKVELDSKGKR